MYDSKSHAPLHKRFCLTRVTRNLVCSTPNDCRGSREPDGPGNL